LREQTAAVGVVSIGQRKISTATDTIPAEADFHAGAVLRFGGRLLLGLPLATLDSAAGNLGGPAATP
jgi:hypothetical protein